MDKWLKTDVQAPQLNFQRLCLLGVLLFLYFFISLWIDIQLGGNWRDWIRPQPTLTLVSIVAGFFLLTWQLNKQHRNTLESNTEAARNRLKLEIYSDLAAAGQRASSALLKLHSNMTVADLDLQIRVDHYSKFSQILPSRHTFQGMNHEQSKAETQVIRLMAAMEKWEIALGTDFQPFKKSIGDHLQQAGQKHRDFLWGMRDYFGLTAKWPPEQDEIRKLKVKAAEAAEAVFDVVMDVWDLRIATQNQLLGGLFTYRIPVRKPRDPTVKVLTLPDESE